MTRFITVAALASLAFVTACKDPELEARVAALETKVAELEKAPKGPQAAAPMNTEAERAAGEMLREAMKLSDAGKYDEAKAKIAELKGAHPDTRAGRQADRVAADMAIIGSDAGEIDVEKWFVGKTDLATGKATLVVFWEVWCPHCQREVPKLQATYDQYNSRGLNMVAVTKVSKTSTDEQVEAFIKEKAVTYPVVKEGGKISERYGIRGIPAAAVVKDGKIVWKGHPASINQAMIEGWIG